MYSYQEIGGREISSKSWLPSFFRRRQGNEHSNAASQTADLLEQSVIELEPVETQSDSVASVTEKKHSERPLLLRGKGLVAIGLLVLLGASVGSQYMSQTNVEGTSSDLKINSTVCLAPGEYQRIPSELAQKLVTDDLKGIYGFFERYFDIHNLYGKMSLDTARDIVASGVITAEDIQYVFVDNKDGTCTLFLVYSPLINSNQS